MSEATLTYAVGGDVSESARSIAREIDRLPPGPAAVYLQKDERGQISQVEICTQARVRLWVYETTRAGL